MLFVGFINLANAFDIFENKLKKLRLKKINLYPVRTASFRKATLVNDRRVKRTESPIVLQFLNVCRSELKQTDNKQNSTIAGMTSLINEFTENLKNVAKMERDHLDEDIQIMVS